MRRTRTVVAGGLIVAVVMGTYAANDYARPAAFVVRAAGMQGVAARVAAVETTAYEERRIPVPWRGGEIRGRLFTPEGGSGRAVLLAPGIHAAGVDEPRLVQFARDLASVGRTVLAIEPTDLTRYRITARATDMIEDAATWLSGQRELAPDGRVGLMGISFAGGLSIVAAGRPALRDRVAFVLSFGGHGDLPRTLRYLCTGVQPDGTARPPHDYGVAIILLGVAHLVVPAAQVEPLRDAIHTFLEASRLDMVDKNRSQAEFASARTKAETLPEPSRTLMRYVNDRDVVHLGAVLLPHVAALGGDPALSPASAAPPRAPVFLLHGADDNVIPAVESVLLGDSLRARGVHVYQLATPLITHAEVDRSSTFASIWSLIRFWDAVLDR